ncbi:Uncharacterised protein [Shigella sonnei]|nr:Uncharacterised protein [Shigella sonnei]
MLTSDRKVIKTTFPPGNFRLHNDIPIAGTELRTVFNQEVFKPGDHMLVS